jgi:serine/threonine protein kinase
MMVAHYRIVTKLANGGMGIIYRAVDTKLGRPVALKLLLPRLSGNADTVARFRLEAKTASALSHPHICKVYDIGEHDGLPFLVMELLEGQTLKDLLKSGNALSVSQTLALSTQLLGALAFAHSKGIVHRDIKPGNIFISSQGQVKLLDFGLAKNNFMQDEPFDWPAETMSNLAAAKTITGSILGTVAYMSPEQAQGLPVDARTDLFSFGLVLYEMATGHPAFSGENVPEMLRLIINDTPARPASLNPALPITLEKVILKALEKACGARYQTSAELIRDLKAATQEPERIRS